ncbi:MAG: beta-lactamase family protein [Chitinophagaceae bacterium]|nr:beta-lactamase family protein [Chitinophagaceae bacterium]
MRKITILAIISVFVIACNNQQKQNPTTPAASIDSSYQGGGFADTNRLEKIRQAFPLIERMYREHAQKNNIPGLAFGLVVDGKLVYAGNYGYTDIAKKTVVTSSSLFRIASMTKSFTAMAILRLRDEGKLQLDDAVEKYISAMKGQPYPTADAPLVTVRHLLTHGAGFPEDNPWGDRQLADTDKELEAFLKEGINFSNAPGVAYEYSNLGYALLGKIITKVSGQPYQQYIRENIWKPLGMNTSSWEYSDVATDKLAHGYRWINGDWREEELLHDTPDGSWGAMGSMITSIEEFSRYMALHLNAWPASSALESGPVRRSSVREMHHPWRFNGFNPRYRYPDGRTCAVTSAYGYGLGWLMDCEGRVMVSHSGGLPGFGSQWRILPDYGIGIVAFGNRTYSPMTNINLQVLDTVIRLAQLEPRQVPVSNILAQKQQELMTILPNWENAEASGLFAENFFADYPIDSLRKQSQILFDRIGPIQKSKRNDGP